MSTRTRPPDIDDRTEKMLGKPFLPGDADWEPVDFKCKMEVKDIVRDCFTYLEQEISEPTAHKTIARVKRELGL